MASEEPETYLRLMAEAELRRALTLPKARQQPGNAAVWAAGLAVADGKLVVDVVSVTGPTAEVLAVSRTGAQPEPLTLART